MTFGETRNRIRKFRALTQKLRADINSKGFRNIPNSIPVSRYDLEILEWGMSRIKVWLPELDDEQEVIPGKGKYIRAHMIYRNPDETRPHLLFKGVILYSDSL